jgi:hypothetical protein
MKRKLFTAPGRSTIPLKSNSILKNVATGVKITYDAFQSLPSDEQANYVNAIKDGVKGIQGAAMGRGGGKGRSHPSRSKSGSSSSDDSGAMWNRGGGAGYSLSKAPQPQDIRLNSPINPNVYVSDYLDSQYNNCSPLHLSAAKIAIPATSSYELYNYFIKVITPDIQSRAQANVSFALDITNKFSSNMILEGINAVAEALQIYYYYLSIITYHSNTANNNEGMIALRSLITADNLESLSRLARRLLDTPVPPNLFQLIRYMAGNFITGRNPGSPLIKIAPIELNPTGMPKTDVIEQCLDRLSSGDNVSFYSLLRRAVPQWVPATLADVPDVPVYDENFLTIFANLPFTSVLNGSTTVNYYPVASKGQRSDEIMYNSFSNNLDGVAFSLTGISLDSKTPHYPSLITVPAGMTYETGNSRMSYIQDVNGVKQFAPPITNSFVSFSRSETYRFDGNGTNHFTPTHLFGADKCLGVCINTVYETGLKTLNWLISLDTIRKNRLNQTIKG